MLRHRINADRIQDRRIFPVGVFDYSAYLQETYPQLDRLDMQEPSGSAAAWNASASLPDAAHTATVVGVPTNFGFLGNSVAYDGAASFTDFESAAFIAKFNPNAGTAIVWIKVANAGVWVDDTSRRILELRGINASYRIFQDKDSANDLRWSYRSNSTDELISKSITPTDWVMLASTWANPGSMTAYYIGQVEGTPQVIANAWVGDMVLMFLGALTATPTLVWNGWLTRFMIGYSTPLTQPQILDIYRKGAGV